jgi:hypothetical protein
MFYLGNFYLGSILWGLFRSFSVVYSSFLEPNDVVIRTYAVNSGLMIGSLIVGFVDIKILVIISLFLLITLPLIKIDMKIKEKLEFKDIKILFKLNTSFMMLMTGYFIFFPYIPLFLNEIGFSKIVISLFYAYTTIIGFINIYLFKYLLKIIKLYLLSLY